MKRILLGFLICLVLVLGYRAYRGASGATGEVREASALIRSQVEQVSKLVVTEGHFAEVFTYRDSRELFGPYFTADKKALVVVNARASVIYDLKALEYRLDPREKILYIDAIPEPEIRIEPNIEYYDVQADYLNPFEAADYNEVKSRVEKSIRARIARSSLRTNAQNRLLSELAEFYALTRTLGWTLVYEGAPVQAMPGPELLNRGE